MLRNRRVKTFLALTFVLALVPAGAQDLSIELSDHEQIKHT